MTVNRVQKGIRTSKTSFCELPLRAHKILADVLLQDVTTVDLPGGGAGRTLADVQALMQKRSSRGSGRAAQALFVVREKLGRLFGWDSPKPSMSERSYLARIPPELHAASRIAPGTLRDMFTVLYELDQESLVELQNATVHAFLCSVLQKTEGGYLLHWAVYVKPVSILTPVYMAAIEPFRRWIVYPSILSSLRSAWMSRYASGPE